MNEASARFLGTHYHCLMSFHHTARSARGCQVAVVLLAIVGSLVGLCLPATAVGQDSVVTYPLNNGSDGSSGFGTSTLDGSLLANSTISAGPGLSQFSVGTDSWSGSVEVLKTGPGTSVLSASASTALANDWYFEITLTPQSTIDLRAVSADWSRGGTTATRGWFVRSSLDGYASDLYSNETAPNTATGLNSVSFDLSGFTNITSPLTFRFYIYTDSTGRYMDFQNIAFLRPMPPTPPPPQPLYSVSLNMGDGTCIIDGAIKTATVSAVFLGYRYVPGLEECERDGFSMSGWAHSSDPTVPAVLPLLIDPSDGVRRYFVASDMSLVALWSEQSIPDTTIPEVVAPDAPSGTIDGPSSDDLELPVTGLNVQLNLAVAFVFAGVVLLLLTPSKREVR